MPKSLKKYISRRIYPPKNFIGICGNICSCRFSKLVFPLKWSHAIEWPLKTRRSRFFCLLLSRLRINESRLAILAKSLYPSRELELCPTFRVWVSHSHIEFVLCVHNVAFIFFCCNVYVVALSYIYIQNSWSFLWSNVVFTCISIPLQCRDWSEAHSILSPLFLGVVLARVELKCTWVGAL